MVVKIGIIGGTGLEKPDLLKNRQEKYVDTPFGKVSSMTCNEALFPKQICARLLTILNRLNHSSSPSFISITTILCPFHFFQPSDALILGEIDGVDVVILSRHGRKHDVNPTNVNYRANLFALKTEGCTHIVVSTACGSLQEVRHVQSGSKHLPSLPIPMEGRRRNSHLLDSSAYDGNSNE